MPWEIIVGCLLCVTIAETAIIFSLTRQMDRILRTINPVYRAETEAESGQTRKHFSMYSKGDNS